MDFNVGIFNGEKKKYKVLYSRNFGKLDIENDHLYLYHPDFMKKIMFDEIDTINECKRKAFFSIILKDGNVFYIGFPPKGSSKPYGSMSHSIQTMKSLKSVDREKNLVLEILKNKMKGL